MNKVRDRIVMGHQLTGGGHARRLRKRQSARDSTTVTVAGDVPIAYAQRSNTMMINPTNGTPAPRVATS